MTCTHFHEYSLVINGLSSVYNCQNLLTIYMMTAKIRYVIKCTVFIWLSCIVWSSCHSTCLYAVPILNFKFPVKICVKVFWWVEGCRVKIRHISWLSFVCSVNFVVFNYWDKYFPVLFTFFSVSCDFLKMLRRKWHKLCPFNTTHSLIRWLSAITRRL